MKENNFGEYIKQAAFPQTVEVENTVYHTRGLTKREYFAAMAMQGILVYKVPHDQLAEKAVTMADALIKSLNESKPTENEIQTNQQDNR